MAGCIFVRSILQLYVMCHLKDFVTCWVPTLNEYLDISTSNYALGIGFSLRRLSTNDVNFCFESMRISFLDCISCVTWNMLWLDENCWKQVCRQKMYFYQALSIDRFSFDNDKIESILPLWKIVYNSNMDFSSLNLWGPCPMYIMHMKQIAHNWYLPICQCMEICSHISLPHKNHMCLP